MHLYFSFFSFLSYMCDEFFLSFVLLSFMLLYVGFFFHVHHLWDFSFYLRSIYCSAFFVESLLFKKWHLPVVNVAHESIPGVSHKDALMHLSMVRKYLEENYTEYNSYYDFEDMIEKNAFINRTQSKITNFFK